MTKINTYFIDMKRDLNKKQNVNNENLEMKTLIYLVLNTLIKINKEVIFLFYVFFI